jgi:hypothetical protein
LEIWNELNFALVHSQALFLAGGDIRALIASRPWWKKQENLPVKSLTKLDVTVNILKEEVRNKHKFDIAKSWVLNKLTD